MLSRTVSGRRGALALASAARWLEISQRGRFAPAVFRNALAVAGRRARRLSAARDAWQALRLVGHAATSRKLCCAAGRSTDDSGDHRNACRRAVMRLCRQNLPRLHRLASGM